MDLESIPASARQPSRKRSRPTGSLDPEVTTGDETQIEPHVSVSRQRRAVGRADTGIPVREAKASRSAAQSRRNLAYVKDKLRSQTYVSEADVSI